MNIYIVSCVFPPEPVVSSRTSSQLAEELVGLGNQVTVITSFPSRPSGELYSDYKRKLFMQSLDTHGFRVIRCFSSLSRSSRMVSRFFENFSFGIMSSFILMITKKPDVIYLNTWPIIAMGFVAAVCFIKGIPLVISIQDIYPESLISQKRLSADNPLVHLMFWVDKHIVGIGAKIILISESFKEIYRLERGLPLERLQVIPNWEDSRSIIADDPKAEIFRKEMNIPKNAFLLTYAGNVGEAAGVETIIQSLKYMNEKEDMYLLIAGEGANLNRCKLLSRQVGDIAKKRILFYYPWNYDHTSMVLSAADLLILPTRGSQSMFSVPSKIISYMLAGRPVLAMVQQGSETEKLINMAECGWVIEPDDPRLLYEKIKEIIVVNRYSREKMGRMGREYAMQNFSHKACIPKIIDTLEKVSRKK